MKIPIIPILLVVLIFGTAVFYIFNSPGVSVFVLDAPRVNQITDLEGVESEVAISPDGSRYAVISSGDLWEVDALTNAPARLTQTPESEGFPAWSPDGRITFTRGMDTWVVAPNNPGSAAVLKADATSLSWSPTGRTSFVRNRGLWLAEPNGSDERQIVEAHANPEMTVRSPRFSPDSDSLAFIKTVPGIRGEVWTLNLNDGNSNPMIADRQIENPLDLAWVNDGRYLVYLTNRSGSYAVWVMNIADNVLTPLTAPLFPIPLQHVGIAAWKDRIVLPRHLVDSDIVWSDGTPVAQTDDLEFEPALSFSGQQVAYTIAKENKFEIWTVDVNGNNPLFRTLGREPRFSPNGFQIVYTHTDLLGNTDLWKLDLRDDSSEVVTDADEIDLNPAWSPDGRNIAFSSTRGGAFSVWTMGTTGGKRLRLNQGGHFPSFSPDGRQILFWNNDALWTMNVDGQNIQQVRNGVPGPIPSVWTENGPRYFSDSEVSGGRAVWPAFDVSRAGRFLVAPIDIHSTALWAIDLTFREVEVSTK